MSTKTKGNGAAAGQPDAGTTAMTSSGAPTLTPEAMRIAGPPAEQTGGAGMPALQPPGSEASGLASSVLAEGIAATTTAKVGGLWTNAAQSNAWVYLNGVGWRRLGPANPGAHHALLQLARLARDAGVNVQCEDDGSVVHNIYVW